MISKKLQLISSIFHTKSEDFLEIKRLISQKTKVIWQSALRSNLNPKKNAFTISKYGVSLEKTKRFFGANRIKNALRTRVPIIAAEKTTEIQDLVVCIVVEVALRPQSVQ